MKNRLSQQHRLLQKMVMAPQMRQSIKLLGMSVKDLSDFIEDAISQNPFLKKIINDTRSKSRRAESTYSETQDNPDYDTVKHEESPQQVIFSQLRMMGLGEKELEIVEYLVYEMDDNGYINANLDEAAENLSAEVEDVERCLAIIQKMEPAGIGARDVKECLEIQLRRMGKESSLEYKIVSGFLGELARNDINAISAALKVDKGVVRKALENIKRLNPKPGSTILARESQSVIPELIAKLDDKKVRLEVNSGSVPQLKMYNPYENNLDVIKDPEARKFLKENMDAAKTLIDNLKRREDTICSVASYILNHQRDALSEGQGDIRTLSIKDVAEELGFHPSTISRAVSNKYIQINDKVFPLKSFLSHGMKKENGEVTSIAAIKKKISELAAAESKQNPLSDSEIKGLLSSEGITIQRRTIAKYRNALGILPTHLRRKAGPA